MFFALLRLYLVDFCLSIKRYQVVYLLYIVPYVLNESRMLIFFSTSGKIISYYCPHNKAELNVYVCLLRCGRNTMWRIRNFVWRKKTAWNKPSILSTNWNCQWLSHALCGYIYNFRFTLNEHNRRTRFLSLCLFYFVEHQANGMIRKSFQSTYTKCIQNINKKKLHLFGVSDFPVQLKW